VASIDIEERKRAALTKEKRADERIQQSERELRAVVEALPAFVGTALPDGSVDFISQSWVDYTGVSREQWQGSGWMSLLHPDDRDRVTASWQAVLAAGTSLDDEVRFRRADGTYRWFLNCNFPLRDCEGNVIKWYAILFDIDDRKRAEDHLRDTRIKLNKASRMATVAEISASIAHELNQPLMSVFANAQAAKRWLAANPPNLVESNASIDRILRDARAADETMQHIRALFKHKSFNKKEASIPDMMDEAVRLVQEDPNKHAFPIERDFDENLPKVSVDPILIQAVFINLISNAIEATEVSRPTSLVKVQAAVTDQNEVLIQVIDNGPGVDDPERIFEPFLTTKEKGMGIGLAVSRSIVEAHGGRIWAENNPGDGATFCVVLPLSFPSPNRIGFSTFA
jgi:PAS domain S-box-containing protein